MSNKYSYYQLRIACQQKMLASLYCDPNDPDAFSAGYIEAVTQKHVLLWAINVWGQSDGWCLFRTEDVLQVYMGDDFEVRLQMLLELDGTACTALLNPPPEPEEDLLRRMLETAKEQGALVTVLPLEDEPHTGTVQQVDDLRLSIHTLDFFGAPDQVRQFPLRNIQVATLGTQEEKMLQKLYDARPKLL